MMPGLLRPISVETERVCLREMQVDDAEYWFRFMNLPAIQEFLPDRFETMEDIRRILAWLVSNYDKDIDRMVRITLSIHTKQWGDGPIGFVSFGPLPEDETRREIAYAMHPEWWGNGIATEAIRVFIPWIRSHITRIPLYASVDERNEASIRVLEKCGFTPASTRAGTGEKCGDGRLLFRLEWGAVENAVSPGPCPEKPVSAGSLRKRDRRAVARAHLSSVPANTPRTPQERGYAECPCTYRCMIHGECLLCVAYHGRKGRVPRCER